MNTLLSLVAALLAGTGVERAPADASAPSFQDPPPSYPHWTGALTAGAIFNDGNTVTSSANANFNAQRRAERDRYTIDGFWNWATQAGNTTEPGGPATQVPDKNDTELTQRNYGAGLKYDYFTTPKFYYYANGSGKVDDIADLHLRAILGAGVGYQWKESEKLKWGTEVGPSGVHEDFGGDDFDADYVAARLGSNLAYQISKSTAFEQVAEVLQSLEDSEDVIAKIDSRLKMVITGKWIAQIQHVLDFDGSVPTGANPGPDGNEETDHRLVLSLGWSLGS